MEIDVKEWLNREGEVFLGDIGIKKGDVVLDFGCGDEPLEDLSDMELDDVIEGKQSSFLFAEEIL